MEAAKMGGSASKLNNIDSNAGLPAVEELKRGLFIPEGGFVAAPPVPQPNIFPLGWTLETPKLAEIYERAKVEGFNPSAIPWDTLDPNAFSADERIAMMYWWALLSNFDSSGPAVFARAMIHAFEMHEEDHVRT